MARRRDVADAEGAVAEDAAVDPAAVAAVLVAGAAALALAGVGAVRAPAVAVAMAAVAVAVAISSSAKDRIWSRTWSRSIAWPRS